MCFKGLMKFTIYMTVNDRWLQKEGETHLNVFSKRDNFKSGLTSQVAAQNSDH